MKDWSELPLDIIDLFVQRLPINDFIRFSCVCKSWRCAAIQEKNTTPRFGPWLIFADAVNDNIQGEEGRVRRCYSLSNNEIFSLPSPHLQGRRGWGSRHGWLITFGLDFEIHLFNPLTQSQISLPSQRTLPLRKHDYGFEQTEPVPLCRSFIQNVAFSCNPSDSAHSPMVTVTYGSMLDVAFASPGDKAWTSLKDQDNYTHIDDIIFYKDRFYSVGGRGTLNMYDFNTGTEPEGKHIASFPGTSPPLTKFYLVEVSGDLHLIRRSSIPVEGEDYTQYHHDTVCFNAYKFDFNKTEWIDSVKDFNGLALFLGNNTSFAISASDYPELKPNCIYFTDDYSDIYDFGFCDTGVYDFETKTILALPGKGRHSLSMFSRPFFFMP